MSSSGSAVERGVGVPERREGRVCGLRYCRPMEPIELTAAGRVRLMEDEVECLVSLGVSLEHGGSSWTACTAVVTNRRVIFSEAAIGFELAAVGSCTERSSGFLGFGHALLDLELRAATRAEGGRESSSAVVLGFRKPAHRDQFRETLTLQSARRQAELADAQRKAAPVLFTTTKAGVAGILRGQVLSSASVDHSMAQAFSDLETLAAHAKEMVDLAERLGARGRAGGREDAVEQAEEQAVLERFGLFGIASPVTRASHGAAFHRELALQVADFTEAPLTANHGVLSLTDVYCLFNRARGTEMVSPSDLLTACELLSELALPARLVTFSSGALALRLLRNNEEDLEAKIVQLACCPAGVSAVEVGLSTGISLLLANEYLLTLEQQRRLCRDGKRGDSLAFFPNIFADSPDARLALATLTRGLPLSPPIAR
ncbi:EAP30/Vps36 family-domain-containing protein [Pavlovales sp. CCMP2436]|nr:EAP30/Vps36 family-domain-containing protein [Pavlovales sp. CCMP2436]